MEKRKSDRVPAVHLVSFAEFGEPQQLEVLGLGATRNLSEGGVLIEAATPLPVGSEAALRLIVDGELVECRGRVVRVRVEGESCEMAFAFDAPAAEALERIRGFVGKRKQQQVELPPALGVHPVRDPAQLRPAPAPARVPAEAAAPDRAAAPATGEAEPAPPSKAQARAKAPGRRRNKRKKTSPKKSSPARAKKRSKDEG
ncbi:MAG: hypothetical protein KatS3mg102_2731 [Planctomycetota bacterium]|nr:MAG: hypothetical protein KatS3mg102_2731 [Planctomycetota bacterium]